MPKVTYTPIGSYAAGSGENTVTFSNLGNYSHLELHVMPSNVSGDGDICIRFNGDSGTNYSSNLLFGTGGNAAASAAKNSSINRMRIGRQNNNAAYPNIIHINNYAGSSAYKTAISRAQHSGLIFIYTGQWRNTAPITSITIFDENNVNFVAGSTFRLYGIL